MLFVYLFTCVCLCFVGEGVSTTNLRIRYLEQMVARLDGEKRSMDEEFGRQRKKFMHEMMQAEC